MKRNGARLHLMTPSGVTLRAALRAVHLAPLDYGDERPAGAQVRLRTRATFQRVHGFMGSWVTDYRLLLSARVRVIATAEKHCAPPHRAHVGRAA